MDVRRDALGQRLDARQTEAVLEILARANWLKRHSQPDGRTAIPTMAGEPSTTLGCRNCRKCRKCLSPFLQFLHFLH